VALLGLSVYRRIRRLLGIYQQCRQS